MEKITGNEPAHPHGAWGQQTGTGLTIRQEFAKTALQGICSKQGSLDSYDWNFLAKHSVKAADALISELNKEK